MAKKTIKFIATIDNNTFESTRIIVDYNAIMTAIGQDKKIVNALLVLPGATLKEGNVIASYSSDRARLLDVFSNITKTIAYINVTPVLTESVESGVSMVVLVPEGTTCRQNTVDMEIEYIPTYTMHDNNEYMDVDARGAGSGKINLASGQLQFGNGGLVYNGWNADKTGIDLDKAHTTYCGKGWKLQLQQYFAKLEKETAFIGDNAEVYAYVDGDGNRHEFVEKYFYTVGDTKHYVSQQAVTVDEYGNLLYSKEGTTYEVYIERKTNSGLTLETDYTQFANSKYLETRRQEQIELEESKEACARQLQSYVAVNKNTGEILARLKNNFANGELTEDAYDTFTKNQTVDNLLLTETEAMQYNSLLLQQINAVDSTGIGKTAVVTVDGVQVEKTLYDAQQILREKRDDLATYTKKESVELHDKSDSSVTPIANTYMYTQYVNYLKNLLVTPSDACLLSNADDLMPHYRMDTGVNKNCK